MESLSYKKKFSSRNPPLMSDETWAKAQIWKCLDLGSEAELCAARARISPGSQQATATRQIHHVKVTLFKYSSFLSSCGTVLHMETFTTSIAVCQTAASTSPRQDLAAELHRAPSARSVWVCAARVALLILTAGLLQKRNWKTDISCKSSKTAHSGSKSQQKCCRYHSFLYHKMGWDFLSCWDENGLKRSLTAAEN